MAASIPEGSVFLVPLGLQRSGLAVVARRVPRGRIVALYLYGELLPDAPRGLPFDLPSPSEAAFIGKFTDYSMRDDTWRPLGVHPDFRRQLWPFGAVAHRDHGSGRWMAIGLDDRNPLREIWSRTISADEGRGTPPDALFDPQQVPTLLEQR